MNREIFFRIILEKPPPGVDFGLQKGKGNNYEIEQLQRSGSEDLCFDFKAGMKQGSEMLPVFTGPFVQGPPNGRFVYIGIGTFAGQKNTPWSRRLKIPLTGISRAMIDELTDNTLLVTHVPGTGKDGGPNCATVKPFSGWNILSANNAQ